MSVELPWYGVGNGEIGRPKADDDHADDRQHVIRRPCIRHRPLPLDCPRELLTRRWPGVARNVGYPTCATSTGRSSNAADGARPGPCLRRGANLLSYKHLFGSWRATHILRNRFMARRVAKDMTVEEFDAWCAA